ncbi:MAG: hypothetical protein JSV88_16290 [Candidatus Aminicenantes bacterium]|nr:MAG: hypothetical protein JSV88_16290 [Candidatus Aminicenantes bacterium]
MEIAENQMKEELKKSLDKDLVPVYVRILSVVPFLRKIPPSLVYLILSIFIFIPYLLVKLFTGHRSSFNEIMGISICVAIICAAGVLLSNAYSNVKHTITLLPGIFSSEQQYNRLKRDIKLLFRSPVQNYISLLFGLMGLGVVYYLDPYIEGGYGVFFFILVFLAFGFSGYGLWLAITTIYWIFQLQTYGKFKLFPVPGQTMALRSTSRLVGIFSLSFSLQVSLFLVALFFINWKNSQLLGLTIYFLAIPFILFCIGFFVYPQLAIKKIVSERKCEIVEAIERSMQEFNFTNLLNKTTDFPEALERYSKIVALHYEMIHSRTFLIDLGTLSKFFSSIAVPIIIFLFEYWWFR